MGNGSALFGIDVSHFQRGLSLSAVKAQGYEFVIAKATSGETDR
jgi:GH25 family lysozyme M1 (1,4-beta-N-acetylmuramidase)